jgi:hypothetical protein
LEFKSKITTQEIVNGKGVRRKKKEKPPVGRNPDPAQSSWSDTASYRRRPLLACKQLGGQAEATGSTAAFPDGPDESCRP